MSTSTPVLTPLLFEQNYVVRPPYPWTEVQAARDKLRDLKTAYDGMEKDKDKVVAYRDFLRNSGRTLAAAICVAAHLSRYSKLTTTALRFTDGLSVLSTSLGLQSLDESNRASEIERCFRDAGFALEDLPPLEIGNDGATNNAPAWRQAVEKLLQNVNRAPLPDPNEVRRLAWLAWDSRLLSFRLRITPVPVDIDYLRCNAEGSPAGRILPARLDTVTLSAATDALTLALAGSASESYPNIFTVGLLGSLGFDLSSELGTLWRDEAVTQFLARAATGTPSSSPVRSLLIIRAQAGSLTASWKIDPSMPTLIPRPDQWQNLFDGKSDLKRYLGVRLQGILFEVDKSALLRDEVARCQRELKRIQDYLPNLKARLLVSRPIIDPNSVPAELRPAILSPPNQADAAKQIS